VSSTLNTLQLNESTGAIHACHDPHHPTACRNQFVERTSFSISRATALAFSSSGHYFAVASGSVISLYNTLACTFVGKLKGHLSAVSTIRWAADDRTLLSTSSGGVVYVWDIVTMQRLRECEFINKACNFHGLQISADGHRAAARSTQGEIHLLSCGASVHHVMVPPGANLPIVLTAGERMLLAGTAAGEIIAWPWPEQTPAPAFYQEAVTTAAHVAPLQHMCVAGMGSLLVTAAGDGTIIVWSLQVWAALSLVRDFNVSALWLHSFW
jgi:WD40 repeat protein